MKLATSKFIAELTGTHDIEQQKVWLMDHGIRPPHLMIGLDGRPKVAEALIENIMMGEKKEPERKRTQPNRNAFRGLNPAHV